MAIAFAGPLSRWFAPAGGDAARVLAGIEAWRADLRAAVAAKVAQQLAWDERADTALSVDLGEAGLLAVRLFALLAERSELEWPDTVPPLLELLPEWRAASDARFERSLYGQLLACSVWLPGDFPVTFRVPMPDGETAEIGSLTVLCDQLQWLNQRTFDADVEALASWRQLPAPPGGDFVTAARRGLAGMLAAAAQAQAWTVPLVVRQA